MGDVWTTFSTNFGSFDNFTYALMAITVVGAAFMMPNMAAIVTATCGGLLVFGFAVFLRSLLAAKDARSVAHESLAYGLALPLSTLLVYGSVFCISIAVIRGVYMLSKR
jgi:hypothetical protein